jgi:hypothetical protein
LYQPYSGNKIKKIHALSIEPVGTSHPGRRSRQGSHQGIGRISTYPVRQWQYFQKRVKLHLVITVSEITGLQKMI